MANDLGGDVIRFTKRLDQALEQGIKTNFLAIDKEFIRDFNENGEVKLPTVKVDGLGNYKRNEGFVAGNGDIEWSTYKLRFDRGRQFSIDDMDDEEHMRLFTAKIMGVFLRDQVVPEVDALRFALLSQGAGKVETSGAITSASDALNAVIDAETYFLDKGLELGDLTLNITSGMFKLLRVAQPWRIVEDTLTEGSGPNTNFKTFDEMRINIIPSKRFYTAIDLLDGETEGEEAGGYTKAVDKYKKTEDVAVVEGKTYYTKSGSTYSEVANPATESIANYYEKVQSAGKNLNFLIAAPGSAEAINKHVKLRYFDPDTNQKADSHLWQYRLFHDLLVYEKKKELIYANVGQ